MDYFQSQGWSKEQSAGIVGNLQAESYNSLNPSAKNGNAEGIAQWLGPRKQAFIKEYGVSPANASFEQQLSFVQKELTTTEARAGNALRNAKSADEAARIFEAKYERSGGSNILGRVNNAQRLMSGEAYTGPVTPLGKTGTVFQPKSPAKASNAKPPAFKGGANVGNVVQIDGNAQPIGVEGYSGGRVTNPLEQFSSFNSIFTLSVLKAEQVNFPDAPDSYKNGNYGNIICRSGGGFADNRASTAYTSSYNPEGKFEFFIDNVNITGIIAYNKQTQGTNATEISFDVFEPYSIGIFLQSVKLAAEALNFPNYQTAPLLLTVEFVGYDSNGNIVPVDSTLTRHIPLKLSDIQMKVDSGGSFYSVSAIPWNEVALSDTNVRFKQDVNISGADVKELLQTGEKSLQLWLNTMLQEVTSSEAPKEGSATTIDKVKQTNKSKALPNEIVIIFPSVLDSASSNNGTQTPTETTLTQDPNTNTRNANVESKLTLKRGDYKLLTQDPGSMNEIGTSLMKYDMSSSGSTQPADAGEIQQNGLPPLRKANFLDASKREYRFPQGTSVITAISEILLTSEYCKTNAVTVSDKPGMVKWFRIETQVYLLDPSEQNDSRGEPPKLFVYRVVPYYVHRHHFMSPTAEPQGYERLQLEAAKEYNYIYTGKNTDILDFQININNSLYTTLYADKNNNSVELSAQDNKAGVSEQTTESAVNLSSAKSDPGIGTAAVGQSYKKYSTNSGGPSYDRRALIAKNFHEALMNSDVEMIELEMEIMGDPYYLADSGMGNFSDKSANFNINQGGSVNYQSGEVDVVVNFRTPIDYNPDTGLADFGSTDIVEGFSGLYRIIELTNHFVKGKFTQTLKLLRRPNQTPVAYNNPDKPAASPSATADDSAPLVKQPGTNPQKALDSVKKGEDSPILVFYEKAKDTVKSLF